MTNRKSKSVKGTDPKNLIEKIIRLRINESLYWKDRCFAINAELIVDRGVDLRYVGGVYAGNIRPTPFLCLLLKLLQILPDKEIIEEYMRQEDFKYLRALGAMYARLTFTSVEIYKHLEPLLKDSRRMRYMNRMGEISVIHMDEFIDRLLTETHYCDIQLPRLQKRSALEELQQLDPYASPLDAHPKMGEKAPELGEE